MTVVFYLLAPIVMAGLLIYGLYSLFHALKAAQEPATHKVSMCIDAIVHHDGADSRLTLSFNNEQFSFSLPAAVAHTLKKGDYIGAEMVLYDAVHGSYIKAVKVAGVLYHAFEH